MSDGRTWGTVIGGVVGFFTGGIGWAAGAAIGGAVGGLLEPKKRTETNRIDDIKVSVSKYGDGIPETWGTNIPTATWVWSTYIIQLPEKQSGGKGGGTENTNYRQFIHGLLCLGKTPPLINGERQNVTMRKLLLDGKLNFDASTGQSIGQALATKENPWADIVLLPGYDDQLPGAIMEAWEGIGNVPAFRGRITAPVFGLECTGGRVPQIQVEIAVGTSVSEYQEYATFASGVSGIATVDAVWGWQTTISSPHSMTVYRAPPNGVATTQRTVLLGTPYVVFAPPRALVGAPSPQVVFSIGVGPSNAVVRVKTVDLETGEIVQIHEEAYDNAGTNTGAGTRTHAAYDPISEQYALTTGYSGGAPDTIRLTIIPSLVECNSSTFSELSPIAFYGNVVYALDISSGFLIVNSIDAETGLPLAASIGPSASGVSLGNCAISAEGGVVWVHVVGGSDQHIYLVTVNGGWEQMPGAADFLPSNAPGGNTASASFFMNSGAIIGPSATGTWTFIRYVAVTPQQVSVADFIEAQNLRAGLTAEQIDVSSIDDTFWGYTIKGPSSARDRIAPLLTYSAIGVVEEDGALRYFHRADHASVATIAYEELGFAEDGSEPGDPFPLVRSNAQEMPRSITVSYNDPYFDYQVSTVKAMRYAVDSVLDEQIALDLAMTGDRAASIARRILFERWLSQITRTCAVSRKYAFLSAGDVITVLSKDGSYGDWMIGKLTDTGARIEIECFPSDSDLLIQTVPGPGSYRAQAIEPLPQPLRAVILDTRIIRDQDDDAGLYVAIDSYADAPANGVLYVGNDDNSLEARGGVESSAPIGLAETVPGVWTDKLVDEKNFFTVNIGDDEFSSISRDLLLTSDENFWALGAPGRWEIGKSRMGDNLGGGRYVLSSHLRGLFGTEEHTGNHKANDTFVLLRIGGILRPTMGVGDLGMTKKYRAIANGRSLNSAVSQSYANTGEGLKPASPINARRAATSRDIQIDRRSRLAMNNLTGALPLGEESEAYRWRFYTSSAFTTLAATVVTTVPVVTAAEQTAAGITPTATAYVRVSQISTSVGPGHELQATV